MLDGEVGVGLVFILRSRRRRLVLHLRRCGLFLRLWRFGLDLGFGHRGLRAARVSPAWRAQGDKRVAREPEGLVDLLRHVDRLKREEAVLLRDFDDEGVGHGLAVLVERDRAAEGGIEAQLREGLAELLVSIAEDALGLFEGEEQRLGVDVVGEREEARRLASVREALAIARRELLPLVVVVAFGDGQCRNRARQQGPGGVGRAQEVAAQGRGARHDGGLPAGLAVSFEEAPRRAGVAWPGTSHLSRSGRPSRRGVWCRSRPVRPSAWPAGGRLRRNSPARSP